MIDRPSPRNLRVLPALALAAMPAGVVVMHVGLADGARAIRIFGALLFFTGYFSAMLIRLFGPRLIPLIGKPLDERELLVKTTAYAKSGAILAMLAAIGCFYMGIATLMGWWTPTRDEDWTYLGLMMMGGWFGLPVLIASWLQSRPVAGDEE
jgi:hypothetical protein